MNPTATLAVYFFGSLLLTLFAFFMILYVTLQKRRQYQHSLEKQRLAHKYQNELLQSRIEVQEQAFQHLSGEIHDNVGQILSLTKLHLYKIAKNSSDETIRNDAHQGSELITKAIADLRNISHTLNGGLVLTAGLVDSIKKELHHISSAHNVHCNFVSEGNPYTLDQEKKLLIFRIIQESLANALKHGQPDKIELVLAYHPDKVSVSIIDNGRGFDTTKVKPGEGLGLNNMKVRADLLKGDLEILSTQEKGTTIKFEMPVTYESENSQN